MAASLAFIILYLGVLLILAALGLHRSLLVLRYYRHRRRTPPPPSAVEWPIVTVQLPIFNEASVVERLLEAVAALRYPRGRLQVQVLDDSTDETRELCRRKLVALKHLQPDLDIEYIHRAERRGFKAGALETGMVTARGELILILDADFVPAPDLLERTTPYFADPQVGLVQCRWEHLNRGVSALTQAQSLMLDGHFIIEHGGRVRSDLFFNFNGTAGIWRRVAIEDAGGWAHDTLTEDLDLSYRAQMKGWRFIYLPEVSAPAELPVEMAAFKSQQFRWAKGSTQVALKLLPAVLRSSLPRRQKIEAVFHMAANVAYPLLMALSLLLLPNLLLRQARGVLDILLVDVPLLFGTTVSLSSFYLASQKEIARLLGEPARERLKAAFANLPFVLAIGIGICVNQSRAVLEALAGHQTEFVRTPKHGITGSAEPQTTRRYKGSRSAMMAIELALALYTGFTLVTAFTTGHYLSMPFVALFFFGFSYVGLVGFWQEVRARTAPTPPAPSLDLLHD
jgi:cellulose synthase/poly-beta-1,6-N-acetylglucosamine synthase-like glycosyltransferase